jgi:hypothetical protein
MDYGISFITFGGKGECLHTIMYILKDTGIRMETNILFEII